MPAASSSRPLTGDGPAHSRSRDGVGSGRGADVPRACTWLPTRAVVGADSVHSGWPAVHRSRRATLAASRRARDDGGPDRPPLGACGSYRDVSRRSVRLTRPEHDTAYSARPVGACGRGRGRPYRRRRTAAGPPGTAVPPALRRVHAATPLPGARLRLGAAERSIRWPPRRRCPRAPRARTALAGSRTTARTWAGGERQRGSAGHAHLERTVPSDSLPRALSARDASPPRDCGSRARRRGDPATSWSARGTRPEGPRSRRGPGSGSSHRTRGRSQPHQSPGRVDDHLAGGWPGTGGPQVGARS